jgi:hypothetical protein
VLVPPRPLPIVHRLYLQVRYQLTPEQLKELDSFGISAEEARRLLESNSGPAPDPTSRPLAT